MTTAPQINPPTTLPALLRLLGIHEAPALQHRPVLAKWLENNPAGQQLRISLRANGYGLQLLKSIRPMRSTVSGLTKPV